MTKGERQHLIRLDDNRWATLKAIARDLVHDSEMPNGTGAGHNRVGTLLRLVADGKLTVVRPDQT